MRIAGFVVGAGVFMSLEPAPIVGGPQLIFGIYKPPRHPRKPSKAAAADSPKAVSAGASAKVPAAGVEAPAAGVEAPAAGVEAPAAGVTKGAATASNQAAPNVSTKAVPGESPFRSADLLHNYRQLSGRVADVSWQAFNVADSGFMKLVLAPTKQHPTKTLS